MRLLLRLQGAGLQAFLGFALGLRLRLGLAQFAGAEQAQRLGLHLLRQALRLALLRRRQAVGAQQALAPGVVGTVGQKKNQHKHSQHGSLGNRGRR